MARLSVAFKVLVLVVLVVSVSDCASARPAPMAGRSAVRSVKNVIVLISDGCGFRHVEAASLYSAGAPGRSVYESFPCRIAMKTDPLVRTDDGRAPSGYDPEAVWADFDHVRRGCTDSAAAATALSTGRKTTNGAIGVDAEGQPLRNVLTLCEELGMATGVVTSVPISHATPAGFAAHSSSRNHVEEIARR